MKSLEEIKENKYIDYINEEVEKYLNSLENKKEEERQDLRLRDELLKREYEIMAEYKEKEEKLIKYLENKIRNTKGLICDIRWSQDEIAYFNHNKDFALGVYTDLLERVKSGKYE